MNARQACGVLVQPDTAVPSSEFTSGFDGSALHTIDGSGLPAGFGPADAHAAYVSGNHWTIGVVPPETQSITWGFSSPQVLGAIYIWNHQSTEPPANNPGYDVTLFDLTLFDSLNAVLMTFNDIPLAPDTSTGQTFAFGSAIAGVSNVRFDIEAVQSSPDYSGLAEVAFETAAVPETSSLAFCGGALLSMLIGRKIAGRATVEM
jgi:hypothetical protein